MSVDKIAQAWIDAGYGNECFWEAWPECPTPQVDLTPHMVKARVEALERENARLRGALMNIGKTYTADGGRLIHSEKQIAALAKAALA